MLKMWGWPFFFLAVHKHLNRWPRHSVTHWLPHSVALAGSNWPSLALTGFPWLSVAHILAPTGSLCHSLAHSLAYTVLASKHAWLKRTLLGSQRRLPRWRTFCRSVAHALLVLPTLPQVNWYILTNFAPKFTIKEKVVKSDNRCPRMPQKEIKFMLHFPYWSPKASITL